MITSLTVCSFCREKSRSGLFEGHCGFFMVLWETRSDQDVMMGSEDFEYVQGGVLRDENNWQVRFTLTETSAASGADRFPGRHAIESR